MKVSKKLNVKNFVSYDNPFFGAGAEEAWNSVPEHIKHPVKREEPTQPDWYYESCLDEVCPHHRDI